MLGKKRAVTDHIQFLLAHFPCVAILGARQVGKSTILKQLRPNSPYFDLEDTQTSDRILEDPAYFLERYLEPVLLDEAQLCPSLFPALRVKIDKNRTQNGQFLLSGSSSPTLIRHISESLAGRIAIVELSPFLWNEAWDQPLSPLYSHILNQNFEALHTLTQALSSTQVIQSCFYGGYPDPFLGRNTPTYSQIWMKNYFETYIQRDIRQLFPGLNNDAYRKFIHMLASASGNIIRHSDFARSIGVSEPTIRHYFDIAEGTFLWRRIPAFDKSSKKRLIKSPKGYIRDTGLSLFLQNIRAIDMMTHHHTFGRFWESSVTEQLIKGFQTFSNPFQYSYYRTQNQAEIDLIIEGNFGCIPIEIKSGSLIRSNQLGALKGFIQDYACPFGVIINQSTRIERISQNILQIPATYF